MVKLKSLCIAGGQSAVFCLLLSALAGFAQPENPPAQAKKGQAKKGRKAKSPRARIQRVFYDFKAAGKKMEYGLFVTSKYDGKTPAPLIVALHGLGSNPRQILNYPGLVDLAEKHGYVVVAPMGYNSRGWYGIFGPRPRGAKPENLGELSELDVMNVVEIIEKSLIVVQSGQTQELESTF